MACRVLIQNPDPEEILFRNCSDRSSWKRGRYSRSKWPGYETRTATCDDQNSLTLTDVQDISTDPPQTVSLEFHYCTLDEVTLMILSCPKWPKCKGVRIMKSLTCKQNRTVAHRSYKKIIQMDERSVYFCLPGFPYDKLLVFGNITPYCYTCVLHSKQLSLQTSILHCYNSILFYSILHCSKYLRDQVFKAIMIYLKIYWEKSFQIVVMFSWIILLDNAVVAEKLLAKLYFLHITQRGITPKTQVYQSHCKHSLYPFKHVQTL